jgi:hypothetical protein
MKRKAVIAVIAAITLLPSVATAGPFSDDMSRCFVNSTSAADKAQLVRWIFSVAALHPALGGISNVSDAQRSELNKQMAQLIERLLTESCAAESKAALKNEGQVAMSTAFGVLGQAAMAGLFSDPTVAAASAAFAQELDQQKIRALLGK